MANVSEPLTQRIALVAFASPRITTCGHIVNRDTANLGKKPLEATVVFRKSEGLRPSPERYRSLGYNEIVDHLIKPWSLTSSRSSSLKKVKQSNTRTGHSSRKNGSEIRSGDEERANSLAQHPVQIAIFSTSSNEISSDRRS